MESSFKKNKHWDAQLFCPSYNQNAFHKVEK